jgi:hypothetical protein
MNSYKRWQALLLWEQRYTAHKKIKSNIAFKKKRKLFISNSINLLISKKAFSPSGILFL